MKVHDKPILTIKEAWLADADRVVRGRLPGAFKKLRNLTSALSSGGIGRIRTGYEALNAATGGVTSPAGMEDMKVVAVQSPEDTNINIYFAGGAIYMHPHYHPTLKTAGTFDGTLQETFTGVTGTVSGFTVSFTGADALGLSTVNDYYNHWTLEDDTQNEYSFITDYAYSSAAAGTATFTIQEVAASPFLNWIITDTFKLHVHFLKLNESKVLTASFVFGTGTNKIYWAGSEALGLSNTNDHYIGWLVHNVTKDEYSIVTDYTYTLATKAEFTLADDVNGAGTLNWDTTDDITFYRSCHNDTTFAPTYNSTLTTLTDPPSVGVENSIIRISGGQGSALGLRGVVVFPRLTRTFLPGTSKQLVYNSTYADKRECVSPGKPILTGSTVVGITDAARTTLETGKTYWIGIALVFDGYQIGRLQKWESVAADYAPTSGSWVDNYIASTVTSHSLTLPLSISLARWPKRVTGIAIYMAQDDKNTSATGRVNPYYFIKHISLVDLEDPYLSGWTYGAATGLHTQTITIDGDSWGGRGAIYLVDAGYLDTTRDTMCAYSAEILSSGRRYIANFNSVLGVTFTDKDGVITNPTGGNSTINNGIIQPDIFPYEDGVLRIRIDPTLGTKINALAPMGPDEFVVLKDRGVISCRVVVVDGIPILIQTVESGVVGCTTPNAWAKDDSGTIYFPSYDDIYSYRNGMLSGLIERPDANDWISTYRAISATNKEGAVVVYLPELKSVLFLFGSQLDPASANYNDLQYSLDKTGWKSVYFQQSAGNATKSFKNFTSLLNGHVIGIDTGAGGTALAFRMTWKYSAGSYSFGYTDNGYAIIPYFDTGDFFFEADEEYIMSEIVINRSLTSSTTTGALDIDVKVDGSQIGFTSVGGTNRLRLKSLPASVRRANKWQMIYNTNATPNQLNGGNVYQIDSVEFCGRIAPRRQAITE